MSNDTGANLFRVLLNRLKHAAFHPQENVSSLLMQLQTYANEAFFIEMKYTEISM